LSVHLIVIIAYLVIMMLAGVYFAKREVKTTEDFMVAGRSLPTFVLSGTLLATFAGSGTIVAGAEFVYEYGPLASIIYNGGVPLGIIVLYFIAGKVRSLEKVTLPEMLEIKYGKATRFFATICIVLAYIGLAAQQLIGGGYILSVTTGLSADAGTIITTILVLFLAVTGGMFSVAYTDFFSALFIVFGMLIALPFLIPNVDGVSGLIESLPAEKLTWGGGLTFTQLLGFILPPFLLILGDQNMYTRFSSAKDVKTARKSTIGFLVGDVLILGIAAIITTTAIVLYPNIKGDMAFLHVAGNALPTSIGAIIFAASIALIITTGNSYLLSVAGNIVYDIYQNFFAGRFNKDRKELSNKNYLRFSRISIIVVGVLAYILGRFFPSVLELQMYSYTMYGATITPSLLAAFFWKRATAAGALSSIIIGGLATVIWEGALNKPMDWNSVLVALPLSLLTLIVVSLVTSRKDKQQEYIYNY